MSSEETLAEVLIEGLGMSPSTGLSQQISLIMLNWSNKRQYSYPKYFYHLQEKLEAYLPHEINALYTCIYWHGSPWRNMAKNKDDFVNSIIDKGNQSTSRETFTSSIDYATMFESWGEERKLSYLGENAEKEARLTVENTKYELLKVLAPRSVKFAPRKGAVRPRVICA